MQIHATSCKISLKIRVIFLRQSGILHSLPRCWQCFGSVVLGSRGLSPQRRLVRGLPRPKIWADIKMQLTDIGSHNPPSPKNCWFLLRRSEVVWSAPGSFWQLHHLAMALWYALRIIHRLLGLRFDFINLSIIDLGGESSVDLANFLPRPAR